MPVTREVLQALGFVLETPEKAHEDAIARGARCPECPLYGCARGPVLGEVRQGSKLTIIGEAPGETEVRVGYPFAGPSGRDLKEALHAGGLTRDDTTITNTVLCQPPEEMTAYVHRLKIAHELKAKAVKKRNKDKPKAEREKVPEFITPQLCCAPRLANDIADAGSKVLLAVGAFALEETARQLGVPFGSKKAEKGKPKLNRLRKQIGAPVRLEDGRVVLASYHPAFAMRKGSRQYRPTVHKHIARAARIARDDGKIEWTEPHIIIEPTIEQVEAFAALVLAARVRVATDIETTGLDPKKDKLLCVGFAANLGGTEHVISIPFRRSDLSEYWSPEDKRRAVKAVMDILNSLELMGHNLSFDTRFFLELGLMHDRRRGWLDTMIAHHDTDANDLPHDLGFVLADYYDSPQHKADVDAKHLEGADDHDTWLYNGRDCLAVLRLMPALEERMRELGTLPQFATDSQMAPVFRDMGELGLVVDRHERLSLLRRTTDECRLRIYGHGQEGDSDYFKGLREMTGRSKFNPRATADVREYLYGKKKLIPIINTGGKPWKKDEDPSTNTSALLKLLERGVDSDTKSFINTLLEFRAYDKLRGTYIKNLDYRKEDWSWAGLGMLAVLHTQYLLHVIPSGRVSTRPAVQNWPERGKLNMRKMIISPPGHVMVGADFDQLELRLYAVIAEDEPLFDAFLSVDQWGPTDVHTLNYAYLEAKKESDVKGIYEALRQKGKDNKVVKQNRNIAKRFVYLETYGGEEDKLFEVMSTERDKATGALVFPDIKESDCRRWHDNWHRYHPATKRWQAACLNSFYDVGCTRSIIDLRARFHPGGLNKRNAVANHVIQASGAALANRAIMLVDERIPHRGWSPFSGLILQVHDSMTAYVPEGRADEGCKVLEESMAYTYRGMPFTAKAKASRCWADQ